MCIRDSALAVDYGHVAADRPGGGTLTGYADGGQVAPVPDGSCDLTAHVAMDSLSHDELHTQRDALRALGPVSYTHLDVYKRQPSRMYFMT